MHRTQIYLDEKQQDLLAALATMRGTTSSALIREAIDRYLEDSASPVDRVRAIRALADRIVVRTAQLPAEGVEGAAKSAAEVDSATYVDNLRAAGADRLNSLG